MSQPPLFPDICPVCERLDALWRRSSNGTAAGVGVLCFVCASARAQQKRAELLRAIRPARGAGRALAIARRARELTEREVAHRTRMLRHLGTGL